MTTRPVSHANRGRGLESVLDLAHDLYWKRERVLVRHYGIAGRYFPGSAGKPRFAAFPKDQQPVDYHGCDRGRLMVFDAKEDRSGSRRWSLDKRYAHQYERLRAWAGCGALAWFAVEAVTREALFLLRIRPNSPWPVIDFALALADSDLLLIRPNDEGYYDWLPVVRATWF
jgi:penicillin-binding protein-related factor A (putative recombinase)